MSSESSSTTFESGQSHRRSDRAKPIDLSSLLTRQPPIALEAEMALLGSMILDWRVIGEVVQIVVSDEELSSASHSAIYKVLIEAFDRNAPVDLVQLSQRLRDLNLLDQIGGMDYLVSLVEGVPSAASAPYYAKIVHEKSLIRRLIDAAGEILHDAHHSGEPAADIVDAAEQKIFRIAEKKGGSDAQALSELVNELYDRLQTMEGRHVTGVETGMYDLDEMTCGLQPGEMIIVAGRPSMGKTAFALNIAEHIGAVGKLPVAVFSLEMSREQLAQRLMCSRSGVEAQRLRRNMLAGDDYQRLQIAAGELTDAPIYIDDTPGLSLLSLRAKARRMASRYGIKAVFIDYMQLMSCPGSESRQQEVSEISRGIKALARELSVPVVCLSQLNRSPEAREGHKPRMSDLRESGSIEQDADVVMMIHREEYYHDDEWKAANPDECGKAEVVLCKQRNGPVGSVYLQFHSATTRFNNLTNSRPPQNFSYPPPFSPPP